jgi:hypothetical protein
VPNFLAFSAVFLAELLRTSAAVTCRWCGCTTDGLNHGSIAECIAALEFEVERLRRLIEQHAQARPMPTVVSLKRRAG